MAERPPVGNTEALRALLEQADAVCRESEEVVQEVDRRMKEIRPIWPPSESPADRGRLPEDSAAAASAVGADTVQLPTAPKPDR
jgi:hypothetical protein